MTIVSRIDPHLRAAREFVIGALGHDFMGSGSAADRRTTFQAFLDQIMPKGVMHPEVRRDEYFVAGEGQDPKVRVLVYTPPGLTMPAPAILFIHGGGFSLGSVDQDDGAAAALALDIGAVIVSVDYRLAPETPYPGPLEDCYAALRWLSAQADELGVDSSRIAVYGHSAGGGLSAIVAQMARDRNGPAICFQMLCYPMLDDRMVSGSMTTRNGTGIFDRDAVALSWRSLLDNGHLSHLPYASAARAKNLAGLPPTFIDTGELDVLLDEDIDYARELMAAGVAVELHVYPNAYHGFDMFAADAPISRQAVETRKMALKRALGL